MEDTPPTSVFPSDLHTATSKQSSLGRPASPPNSVYVSVSTSVDHIAGTAQGDATTSACVKFLQTPPSSASARSNPDVPNSPSSFYTASPHSPARPFARAFPLHTHFRSSSSSRGMPQYLNSALESPRRATSESAVSPSSLLNRTASMRRSFAGSNEQRFPRSASGSTSITLPHVPTHHVRSRTAPAGGSVADLVRRLDSVTGSIGMDLSEDSRGVGGAAMGPAASVGGRPAGRSREASFASHRRHPSNIAPLSIQLLSGLSISMPTVPIVPSSVNTSTAFDHRGTDSRVPEMRRNDLGDKRVRELMDAKSQSPIDTGSLSPGTPDFVTPTTVTVANPTANFETYQSHDVASSTAASEGTHWSNGRKKPQSSTRPFSIAHDLRPLAVLNLGVLDRDCRVSSPDEPKPPSSFQDPDSSTASHHSDVVNTSHHDSSRTKPVQLGHTRAASTGMWTGRVSNTIADLPIIPASNDPSISPSIAAPTFSLTSMRPAPAESRHAASSNTLDSGAVVYAIPPGLPAPDPLLHPLLGAPQKLNLHTSEILRLYTLLTRESTVPGGYSTSDSMAIASSLKLAFRETLECLEKAAEDLCRGKAKAHSEGSTNVKNVARDVESLSEIVQSELSTVGRSLAATEGMNEVFVRAQEVLKNAISEFMSPEASQERKAPVEWVIEPSLADPSICPPSPVFTTSPRLKEDYRSFVLDNFDYGAGWFNSFFIGRDHKLFVATSSSLGSVIISIVEEGPPAADKEGHSQGPSRDSGTYPSGIGSTDSIDLAAAIGMEISAGNNTAQSDLGGRVFRGILRCKDWYDVQAPVTSPRSS
ncbi:hypothetical protein M427DRAFT_70401 [Gonapodya prolifera JEL478]|uniref:Uncharacterized protein n=1 Tax=Gonapodya prolifera (strain JEL478) TaxID=1344416 RepID=A0A139ADL4_GONPJ|nr:hypothetical protein M427DRAFT_70401 [Gonapodya prolifera JEL478]|eukprot:KXS14848.1 hypothetical protein M427DRAFT_70401 [Gonapodya prolifera JEL478]